MKLLVVTQAVDLKDPVLGFFHRWLEGFAGHAEHVHVVCLRAGQHALPANVSVHSLGKEDGRSLLKYLGRFYRFVWTLRNEYDGVFVHMNQEYMLLGGFLWRLFGKRIVLWRNHKAGSMMTRIAGFLAHTVCYTSPSAFVARFANALQMPIGIDTERFKLAGRRQKNDVLFLGRLDPVKRPDIFIEAIRQLRQKGINEPVDLVGDPTRGNEMFAEKIKTLMANLEAFTIRGAVPNHMTPLHYAAHSVYVNLTPSGSFDKTIGEAMASGCIPVVANRAAAGVIPDYLIVDPDSAQNVARGIETALQLDETERNRIRQECRRYIEREHSLERLFGKLMPLFKPYD